MEKIEFFEPDDAYGWLTALSAHPIEIDGQVWATAEHYYQAQKFADERIRQAIAAAPNAHAAKIVSKQYKSARRADWDDAKVDIMRQAFREKFKQHPQLAQQLVATGDAILVEVNIHDPFWGSGPDGNGQNWAGKLVMEVRAEL